MIPPPSPTFIRRASRDAIEQASLAVLEITKQDVQRGRLGEVVDRLMMLTDDDLPSSQLQANLVLAFDGFDGDARYLYGIPEVCDFMRALTAQWPHWFHFLERDTPALPGLLCMLVDHIVVDGHPIPTRLKVHSRMLNQVSADLYVAQRSMLGRLGKSPVAIHRDMAEVDWVLRAFGLVVPPPSPLGKPGHD